MATSVSQRAGTRAVLGQRSWKPAEGVRVEDRWRNRDWLPAIGMLGPNVAMYCLFVAVPIVGALVLSFTSWGAVGFPHFIGLGNYRQLLADTAAWHSILTSLLYMAFGVVPTAVIALLLAMLINVQVPFITAMRTLYFVPAIVSFAASSVLWSWFYRPGTGILDFLLYKVGIVGPDWLGSTTWALPSLAIINIWTSLPAAILLYLAALQRIPESLIEAAMLDGAGSYRRMRHVVLPGVRTMTVLVFIIEILGFWNGSFDLANILTKGGPINATTTFIYYIYNAAFGEFQFGYASTLALIQMLIFVVLLGLGRMLFRAVSR
jgi:multiple sugar transport system permease protein